MNKIILSDHAIKRAKERFNIKPISLLRMAYKAKELGVVRVNSKTKTELVYKNIIYGFKNGNILATVYEVPEKYKHKYA